MDTAPISSSFLPTNSQTLSVLIDTQEYFLINDNIIYKIIIGKNSNEIFIKNKNYMFTFNENDLTILTHIKFNSIDEAYDFLIDLFEENRVIIQNIIIKKEMKLIIKIELEKEFKLTLKYGKENNKINENNNEYIINEINQLKNKINDLKQENMELKNEIIKLNKYHENNNPKDINYLSDIANDSFGFTDLDNSFTVFKAINNIFYLIYSNKDKSIICYDLNRQRISKKLENKHNKYITNFRHFLDDINKVDLIMSISGEDNNIKVWNLYNWEQVLDITKANYVGFLYSGCFLRNEDNNIYIVSSNRNKLGNCESIKVFDFNGYITKEINNSKEQTYFIDAYYDDIFLKVYIVTGNVGFVKSYDYNKGDVYHKYNDIDFNSASFCHFSVVIKNCNGKIKLMESCFDGIFRIWNFHTGLLLNKIKVNDKGLRGICLWNDDYIFIGCDDKNIKLIELKNGLIVKSYSGHVNEVITVKKINHPHLGECLLSQNGGESKIKIWR